MTVYQIRAVILGGRAGSLLPVSLPTGQQLLTAAVGSQRSQALCRLVRTRPLPVVTTDDGRTATVADRQTSQVEHR